MRERCAMCGGMKFCLRTRKENATPHSYSPWIPRSQCFEGKKASITRREAIDVLLFWGRRSIKEAMDPDAKKRLNLAIEKLSTDY